MLVEYAISPIYCYLPERHLNQPMTPDTAAVIAAGVPKPVVLRWADWNAGNYAPGRRVRGEVQSLALGRAISPGSVLHGDPTLPEQWWADLATALTNLARHPVPEREHDVDTVGAIGRGTRDHFHVDLDPHLFDGLTWTTAHADLHWANLHGPELCLVDWESWRGAPAGCDAATLYCTSLLHPPTAARVRELFAPILDTDSGRVALLAAVCRYLALDTDAAMTREPMLHAIVWSCWTGFSTGRSLRWGPGDRLR